MYIITTFHSAERGGVGGVATIFGGRAPIKYLIPIAISPPRTSPPPLSTSPQIACHPLPLYTSCMPSRHYYPYNRPDIKGSFVSYCERYGHSFEERSRGIPTHIHGDSLCLSTDCPEYVCDHVLEECLVCGKLRAYEDFANDRLGMLRLP
ncbi:unnamed protein product [Sphagnum balticum]